MVLNARARFFSIRLGRKPHILLFIHSHNPSVTLADRCAESLHNYCKKTNLSVSRRVIFSEKAASPSDNTH